MTLPRPEEEAKRVVEHSAPGMGAGRTTLISAIAFAIRRSMSAVFSFVIMIVREHGTAAENEGTKAGIEKAKFAQEILDDLEKRRKGMGGEK